MTLVPTDPTAQTLRLPDGRRLGFADYGIRAGVPMLFLHGQPGSRLTGALLDDAARAVGVRLIAVDRPGIGLSDPVGERTHSQFAGDLTGALEALELGPTPVIGWSAGGAYALAWAAARPESVPAVAVLGGVGPGGALEGAWSSLAGRLGAPAGLLKVAAGAAPVLARAFREGVRQGTAAARLETRLLAGDWDFDPTTITVPTWFWHGKEDTLVPWSQTRALAARIPNARTTLLPREGHVSLLVNHGAEILRTMARM